MHVINSLGQDRHAVPMPEQSRSSAGHLPANYRQVAQSPVERRLAQQFSANQSLGSMLPRQAGLVMQSQGQQRLENQSRSHRQGLVETFPVQTQDKLGAGAYLETKLGGGGRKANFLAC